jgi:hypothetical protein
LPASLVPGSTFSLTVLYGDAEVPALMREETLALYSWDGDGWVSEPTGHLEQAGNVVTATPDHFSLWAVLGEIHHVYLPLVLRNQ